MESGLMSGRQMAFPLNQADAPPGRSIWLHCPVLIPNSGWGNLSVRIAEGLAQLGVFCYMTGCTPENRAKYPAWIRDQEFELDAFEWCLHVANPTVQPPPGKRIVAFTMSEVDRVQLGAVQALSKSEHIIVPSAFSERVLRKCDIENPITRVPLGIDPEIFWDHQRHITHPFVFGTAGTSLGGGIRKNLGLVIEAFLAADLDAELRVKVPASDPWECPTTDPRVTVDRRRLSDAEMAEWYAGLSVYVSAAGGEGWGLMTHEAMAVGRPAIVVPYSGTNGFWNTRCGWGIDYDLEPATGWYGGYGARWAKPRLDSLIDAMATARENVEAVIAKGRYAAWRVAALTWNTTAHGVLSVLRQVGAII